MYRPVQTQAPATKPVTLTEVKAHLDVSYSNKDAQIEAYIAAATAHLDGWTGILGRCLCEQTWRQDFDRFNRVLRLPLAPVIDVDSVAYEDVAGATQTIDEANYELLIDDLGPYVKFLDSFAFPQIHDERPAVHVTYLAGYPTVDGVWSGPADIKHAILLLVRHWFDNPSAVNVGNIVQVMPMAVDALLAKHRRIRF